MKRTLLLVAGLFLLLAQGRTQVNVAAETGDTAHYPYWIEMMQDPDANFFATQRAFYTYWTDRKITKGCGYKVFKRWEYFMGSRVAPDGTKPAPDAVMQAVDRFEADNALSVAGAWVNMGPAIIPSPGPAGYEGLGRLNVVAFHPTDVNTYYVGAPSGGMWQTSDGGATWITHTDTMPTLGVSAIVVDYSNPSKILIGSGDRDAGDAPGLGVFKSLDGGATWSHSNTGMNNKTVGKLIQHPSNAQTFLAATSGGVYRSTDGGANWTNVQTGNFKDIHFKPGDPNIVYAMGGSEFYRSSNNGVSFTKITAGLTSGQRGVIAVTPANPNYVYFMQSDGSSGFKGLYRSADAGLTFTTMSTSPNILDWSCDGSGTGGQGWYDLALAADPVNPEVIYAGGVDVWKSTNGGVSWAINSHWYGGCGVPSVHADCHYLVFSPLNNRLWAANDGGLWYSTNGSSWTDNTVGMTIGQIYKLGQSQTVKDKVINGFQDNGTYTHVPGGWWATGGGDGMECAIDYENAAYSYHTIYYGDIYRKYNNGGETHIAGVGVNGITESGGWVTPFCLSEADHKGMFVGYKNIWRCNNTINYPVVWTKISESLAGSNGTDMTDVEHSPANPDIFYASRSDSRLFRCDNVLAASPTWYDLTSHLPASGTARDIQADPLNENIVFIALGNGVYKSFDKGMTWINYTANLPAIPMNALAVYKNAAGGVYVGSDAGVFYRDTTTTGWIPFSEGLPDNAEITELEIYYDNDSVSQDAIRASTYGRGLWGSDMYHSLPDAEFTTAKTTVPTGCPVDFTDLSTGTPTFFLWTFDGGTPATSTLKNPQDITYALAGTYTVKLKVWNEFGADSVVKTNYITVSGSMLPTAGFTADNFVLCAGKAVQFTDLSDNCPTAWSWVITPATISYQNGTSNHSQHPVILFNEDGWYDVQLTVSNGVGNATETKYSYILQGGYGLPFTENFSQGFAARHWTVMNTDQGITWDTITVGGLAPGNKAAWMNFFAYTAVDRRDQLISSPVNLTGYSGATLTFRHAYEQRVRRDSLIIKVSSDCGNSWTRIWAMGPNGSSSVFVTHPSTNNDFYPQSNDDWCSGSYGTACYSIDLSSWAGLPSLMVMFESFNRYGNNLFITDIDISGPVGMGEKRNGGMTLTVHPNPAPEERFNVEGTGFQLPGTVTVMNAHGQAILAGYVIPEVGRFTLPVDLTGVPRGIYIVRFTSPEATRIAKVVIE